MVKTTKWLTPAEAARELRVTTRTVYSWLRAGKLRAAKIGGVWRINEAAMPDRGGQRREDEK